MEQLTKIEHDIVIAIAKKGARHLNEIKDLTDYNMEDIQKATIKLIDKGFLVGIGGIEDVNNKN